LAGRLVEAAVPPIPEGLDRLDVRVWGSRGDNRQTLVNIALAIIAGRLGLAQQTGSFPALTLTVTHELTGRFVEVQLVSRPSAGLGKLLQAFAVTQSALVDTLVLDTPPTPFNAAGTSNPSAPLPPVLISDSAAVGNPPPGGVTQARNPMRGTLLAQLVAQSLVESASPGPVGVPLPVATPLNAASPPATSLS